MEILLQTATSTLLQDHAFEDIERIEDFPHDTIASKPTFPDTTTTKTTREDKLFELFTSFAIQTDDPTSIRLINLIKLLQECRIVRDTLATSSTRPKDNNKLQVALTIRDVEMLASKLALSKSKCTYNQFLKLLWAMAQHIHPTVPPSLAFKYIVEQCVQAPRTINSRITVAIDVALPCVTKLLGAFESSLKEIFRYYATPPEAIKLNDKKRDLGAKCVHWSYANAMIFVRKYGLMSYVTLTEFAAMYAESLCKVEPLTRRLTYQGFCQLVVRLAMQLPAQSNEPLVHLKALFQLMWLHCAATKIGDNSKAHICSSRNHIGMTTNALLKNPEAQQFMATFLKMWKKDHFIDYMTQMYPKPNPANGQDNKHAMNEVLQAVPGPAVYSSQHPETK